MVITFVVPNEHVRTLDFTILNGIGELISIASVSKEEQVLKRHIEVSEVLVVSELKVVFFDSFEIPHKPKFVFAKNPVGLLQQAS